jgi:hypothetical protein
MILKVKGGIDMMPGFGPMGIVFGVVHVAVIVGAFYFLYSISTSLKRIADQLDKK